MLNPVRNEFPKPDFALLWLVCLALLTVGCGKNSETGSTATPPAVPTAPEVKDPLGDQIREVQQALIAANPGLMVEQIVLHPRDGVVVAAEFQAAGITNLGPLAGLPLEGLGVAGNPVADLSPLKGMMLQELDLEGTAVSDLSPLAGMPLKSLWLNSTPVSDLTPLRGAPLMQLSLLGTRVTDLTPLTGAPLESLWLNETAVTDLTPLRESPIVSLTVHRTPVSNLDVVRNWPTLQRLHIGESNVTNLKPLQGLRLTRLIVTPGRIQEGWEVIRQMDTLTELDIEFRDSQRWAPAEFWAKFDGGEFSQPAAVPQ